MTEHKYTNQEIEIRLGEMLHEILRRFNQEDSIKSLEYDPTNQECVVKLKVHIVERDDYIGFGVY